MRLSRGQISLLLLVSAIVVFFSISGYKTASVRLELSKTTEAVDLEGFGLKERMGLDSLSLSTVSRFERMEKDTAAARKLVIIWDSLGKQVSAALSMQHLAEISGREGDIMLAGSRFYEVAGNGDSLLKTEASSKAKESFNQLLKMNPSNVVAKNALASCYVELDGDVMKGVSMLKEIIAEDSNNLQAIFTLGMLSMQSGQLEKAKSRFEKLVKLQPFNAEFYYYLGEVYAKNSEKGKALESYGKCRTLLQDEEARKQVDDIIKKLKSI